MRSRPFLSLFILPALLAATSVLGQPHRSVRRSTSSVKSTRSNAERRTPNAAEPPAPNVAEPPAPNAGPLAAGDAAYGRKSYVEALKRYREALAGKQVPDARLPLVEYRAARCVGLTGDWDRGIEEALRVAARYPGTLWDARMRSWLMRLYLKAPDQGWKLGDRIYRGDNVPEADAALVPERVNLADSDRREAVANGEQARAVYEALRPKSGPSTEEAGHAADLAQVVAGVQLRPWAEARKWKSPSDPAWELKAEEPYDAATAPPKKLLQLYLTGERVGGPEQKPLARLAQALWLRRYQALMREVAVREKNGGKPEPIPYPYQDRSPFEVLGSLVRDFPTHPEAERARLRIAEWQEEDGRYTEALDAYRRFLKERRRSRWVKTAQDAIAEITRVSLELKSPAPQPPGKKAVLSLRVRNLPTLKLTARRIKLEDLVQDERILAGDDLGDAFEHLEARGARRYATGDPVTWEAKPVGEDPHAPVDREIETPLTRNGAYLVEAEGGAQRAAVLLLISDLAAVRIADRDRTCVMAVNAETGAPVPEASTLVRELYRNPAGKVQASSAKGTTDAEGLVEKAREAARPDNPRGELARLDVLVWKGDRYALVDGPSPSDDPERAPACIYTERPVYRPGQSVFYRVLLASPASEEYAPLKGQKVSLKLLDPRNAVVDTQELISGEFGSAHGKIELPPGAPPGRYRIVVAGAVDRTTRIDGAAWFQVEEYRKPEFEVTVSGGAGPARVGDLLTAKVSARYYFGAPVPGAKVRFTVHRQGWTPGTPLSFDWLPRTRVLSGTAVTDAGGEATLRVPTRESDSSFRGQHLKFIIDAEVTDASRRTVQSSGVIRALGTAFGASVRVRQGFYAQGERVEADIRTQDAGGRAVPAAGTARVLRVTAKGDEEQSEEVYRAPVKTDLQGSAPFAWVAPGAGCYEVRFESRDDRGLEIAGSDRTWVAGDAAGAALTPDEGVQLIPELDAYRPGRTARVLVVAREPGCTLLLTHEAGDHLLERRLVRMSGRSMVVEVPVTRAHSPDVVIAAAGVRGREFFHGEATLSVPAVERQLQVEVAPDRTRYAPGEHAAFRVRTRDWQGRPVRTECSVGIIDTALLAIQPDLASVGDFVGTTGRGSDLLACESLSSRFSLTAEAEDSSPDRELLAGSFPEGLGTVHTDQELAFLNEWYALTEDVPGTSVPGSMDRRVAASNANALLPGPGGVVPAQIERAVAVRRRFADTAFWSPAVVTDARGEATVQFTWPDNLGRWRATACGWSTAGQGGEGIAEVETAKDLLVRLQAPRFLMERDELALSANVHNYTSEPRKVRVALQMEGDTVVPASTGPDGPPQPRRLEVPRADRPAPPSPAPPAQRPRTAPQMEQWVEVARDGQARVDWRVRVDRPGMARLRVIADAGSVSDAVEMEVPVRVHGIEKQVIRSAAILMGAGEKPGKRTAKLSLDVPAERATEAGELVVQISPSAAAAMLDALPYVVDYPYGCVEQTMSRFLPAALCARALADLGIDLEVLRRRAQSEYERRKGASDQETALWQWRAERSPVYNPEVLRRVVTEGVARLRRFQHADGGWGWWAEDASDPLMSAHVTQGLAAGKAAGLEVPQSVLDRGFAYLEKRFAKETGLHELAYLGWVLTLDSRRASTLAPALLERIYPAREGLTAYGLALLALALKQAGKESEARVCMQNLENTAHVDTASGTCSWVKDRGETWHWYNNDVETAAACLRVYTALEPKHRLAPLVVRWLVNNRAGDAWSTTKETAAAIQSLAEYLRAGHELAPDYQVTVDVGGRFKRTFDVTPENALLFDNRLVVPGSELGSGSLPITITREGQGNLYVAAALRCFSLEEGIRAAGSEIRARRRYFRLTRPVPGAAPDKDASPTRDGYVRSLLRPGEALASGDRVEVEILLESKDSYEYLVFEDMKPAGCEPVDLRSGTRSADGLWSNMELRDDRVSFFITRLPQGKRMLSYRLRAELPGQFHALPLRGYAMYSPSIHCLSDEGNLGIDDLPQGGLNARDAEAAKKGSEGEGAADQRK